METRVLAFNQSTNIMSIPDSDAALVRALFNKFTGLARIGVDSTRSDAELEE